MKIAIYGRVSTEKQEKQETINSQLDALRDYAKKNNYIVYQEYLDDGYSGELLDRPALDKLRDDAKKKLFEAVLIHSPDRLSRKYIYFGLVQLELKKSAVDFIFLNRPDSKDTPEDNLLNGMQGLIAEFEKAKILERTRRGRLHKAKRGVVSGGRAPYGYRYINIDRTRNIDGHYEVNKEEAKVVKLIYELFVNKGLSIRAIIKELTSKGIKPQRGIHWRSSTVHRVLTNETYTGTTHYNKHMAVSVNNGNRYYRKKNNSLKLRPKDQWIPISLSEELAIIDKDVFLRAQNRFKRNAELSLRNTKHQYLLRSLVVCGNCNSPFGGIPYHNKLFYKCRNRHRQFPMPATCKEPAVEAYKFENAVWNTISEAFSNPRLLLKNIDKLNERKTKTIGNVEEKIKDIDQLIEKTRQEEDRLLDAYKESIISIEQLKEKVTEITAKRNSLITEKEKLQTSEDRPTKTYIKENVYSYCNAIKNKLQGLDFNGKRYILTQSVNTITYHKKEALIRGAIPVEVAHSGNIESIAPGCYESLLPQPLWPFLRVDFLLHPKNPPGLQQPCLRRI